MVEAHQAAPTARLAGDVVIVPPAVEQRRRDADSCLEVKTSGRGKTRDWERRGRPQGVVRKRERAADGRKNGD